MANWVFNPFTDELDYAGSGGGSSYIDGVADTAADLPVTQGDPPLDAVFVVKQGSGVWLINRKPAGLYCRIANNGDLDDWEYLGAFPEVNADGNWALYNSADPTKELKFDVSGVSASTVRTLTVPDANGTIALTAQLTDTQIFTANGTWTKPAGAKLVHYLLIGGGGGGGGGRRSDSSTAAAGGGGGRAGCVNVGWAPASYFGSTETVTIGSGGAGSNPRNGANNANGIDGNSGGTTLFGSVLQALGGTLGGGGTTSAGGTGAAISQGVVYYGTLTASAGVPGASISANGIAPVDTLYTAPGGPGGGKSAANVYYTGGNGGGVGAPSPNRTGVTAGASASASSAGGNGITSHQYFGTGGAGGSPNTTTGAANPGGDGGLYGAGGGGGSGCLNDAGGDETGGDGAAGIVVITTYF